MVINPDKKIARLIDLKTTSKSIAKFENTIEYYRYHRQLAFYVRAVMKYLLQNYPDEKVDEWNVITNIVAVETSGLHECRVFQLSVNSINTGMSEIADLLVRIAYGTRTKDWTYSLEEVKGNGVITLDIEPDE